MKPADDQAAVYHPKGGMCRTCQDLRKDCSSLRFETMPVLHDGGSFKVVKCTEYQRMVPPHGENGGV